MCLWLPGVFFVCLHLRLIELLTLTIKGGLVSVSIVESSGLNSSLLTPLFVYIAWFLMVCPCFLALVVMSHWLLDIMCEKWSGSEWCLLLPERVSGSLAGSYQRWRWLSLDIRIWEGCSPSGMLLPCGLLIWNLDNLPKTSHPLTPLVSPELQFLLPQNQETALTSDCLCILSAVTLRLRPQPRWPCAGTNSRTSSLVLHGLLLSGILALESCLPRLSSKSSQCLEGFLLVFIQFP